MSAPIKSSVTKGQAPGGVSGATELMARLQAQARGMDAQGVPQSFASLMSQHAPTQPAAKAAPAQPGKAASSQTPAKDPAAKAQATARANEQALARARQQALAAQSAAQQGAQSAAQANELAMSKASGAAAKSRRADQTVDDTPAHPANEAEGAAQADAVRDGKPPVGDTAGMMAWLANLRAEAKPDPVTGAQALEEGAQDPGLMGEAAQKEWLPAEVDGSAQAGLGADQSGMALDPSQWQQTTALAGLQVDALLGRDGLAEQMMELKAEAGALSNVGAGAHVRPAGVMLAGATRHEAATLPTPPGHADFGQALADQVRVWVNTARTDGPMTAELHLNPADMGPIQVKIALEGQSAKVDFAAAAAETRKAIEASLTALSTALSDVGLNLTGGGVSAQTSQQSFGQQSAPSEGARGVSAQSSASSEVGDDGDAAFMRSVSAPRGGRPGGLDLYA